MKSSSQEANRICNEIKNYITQKGYTCTVNQVIKWYFRRKKGEELLAPVKHLLSQFENKLDEFYNT